MAWTRLGLVAALWAVALAVPLGQVPDIQGFDEAFPEEVPGLFEGDIDLRPGENPMNRNAMRDRRHRWPNGVVPFEIDTNVFHASDQAILQAAMKEIMDKTTVNGKKCITFVPRQGESAYIRFVTGTGCHTPVGKGLGRSEVTLGRGCMQKGTAMHEILHALGFWHEQSRPDRDTYVTVHWDNIEKGHEHNFDKYSTAQVDTLGEPYDYGSVMHYGAYSFAVVRSKPTIEPTQRGVTIGQRVALSGIDVEKIKLYYDCMSSSQASHPTNAPATTQQPVSSTGDECSFESGWCGWQNVQGDSADWTLITGSTASLGTGPTGDHTTGRGHYAYVEASGNPDHTAILQSPALPIGEYCLGLWYHMYGVDEGSLSIYLVLGSTRRLVHTVSGNQANQWHHYGFHLTASGSGTFHIQILGHVGKGFHSDIAIDDILIHHGACPSSG